MMLSRYHIVRGRRPANDPLPAGIRQDTRKHTKHCLRPTAELVVPFLDNPTSTNWQRFSGSYRQRLGKRFRLDPTPFDRLAESAVDEHQEPNRS